MGRKITQQITEAFLAGKTLKVANSSTDGTNLYLHDNLIATKKADGLHMTVANDLIA